MDEKLLAGYESLGNALLDLDREKRVGLPEAVFGAGKTSEDLVRIAGTFLEKKKNLLITKLDGTKIDAVKKAHPAIHLSRRAGMMWMRFEKPAAPRHPIAILSAGTSDQPIFLEAVLTAVFLGNRVLAFSDVGVAGLHRLVARIPKIRDANLIIAVAGMEGALATVVSGLTGKAVVAVPTSVGYGAGAGGIAPLLTMLASCSPTVSVVNIDNGFGAACLATVLNRQMA